MSPQAAHDPLEDSKASTLERESPKAMPTSPSTTDPATWPTPQSAVTTSAFRRVQSPTFAMATKGMKWSGPRTVWKNPMERAETRRRRVEESMESRSRFEQSVHHKGGFSKIASGGSPGHPA